VELTYFDSLAFIGKKSPLRSPAFLKDTCDIWTADELLAEMDHAHIAAALVTHSWGRWYDTGFGNERLMQEIAGRERLFPCWTAMPHFAGEMPVPEEMLAEMGSAGVRAVKIYPVTAISPLCEEFWGPLLCALEAAGVPILIERKEAEWKAILDLLDKHPRLPVVLQKVGWGEQRNLLCALERSPNLYCEFSGLQANRFIEFAVSRFGHERFLFGADMPMKNPGAARAYIDYAAISDEAKKAIAAGNLARLLGVEVPHVEFRKPDSPLLARAMEGKPFDETTIIDAHAHILHDGGDSAGQGYVMLKGDAEGMIELNRRIGIDRTCISSWLGIMVDPDEGTKLTADIVRRFPDCFTGYANVDPVYTDDLEAEIKRDHEQYGLPGLKPYFPTQKIPYDDERYAPWFEYANSRRLFALLHGSGQGFAQQVANLAEEYPEVALLLAHSGSGFPYARMCIGLAKEHPNVYLELTYTAARLGIIELMVSELGAERVLFGTDAPMRDPRPQFGWLVYSHISDKDRRLILGENMSRILARVIPM